MRINGLILLKHPIKQKRLHVGKVMNLRSNLRWCSDIFDIRCWNGEKVFVARKRALFHHEVIELMDLTVTHRFSEFVGKLPHSIQWLTDNGPQFIAKQTIAYGESWELEMITRKPHPSRR